MAPLGPLAAWLTWGPRIAVRWPRRAIGWQAMDGCPPEYNCRMSDALTGFLWLLAMLVVALVGAWLLVDVLFGKRP